MSGPAASAAGAPTPWPAAATVGTAIDRAAAQHSLDGIVHAGASSVIAELRDGPHRVALGSGVSQLGTTQPAVAAGRFRIGSVTKTFTATVLLQLVQEGKVGLDDPIERYLPGVVPNGSAITVPELLKHTSGVFDYSEDTRALPLKGDAFLIQTRYRTFAARDLVAIATSHPPYFAPGTGFHSDNSGYVLAGMVIQSVTHRPYAVEIEQRILCPLHLKATSLPGTATAIAGRHAHGYLHSGPTGTGDLVDVTRLNPSWASSAGEMLSTTADLNRFFAALLGGRLLRLRSWR